jgi:dTDP-4-amino-4,6-dideoxygalactose transaminase
LRTPARALGLVAKTPPSELNGASQPDYAAGLHPLSAALGLQQLGRAEAIWRLRQTQAERYDELLAGSALLQPVVRASGDVLLRYPVQVVAQQRERVMQALTALDIVPGVWFNDVVHPRGSLRYGYQSGQCPIGEAAAVTVLNLPLGLHADLSRTQAAGLRALASS